MNKTNFKLPLWFYEPISHFSDEQLGRLFRAIYLYQAGQTIEPAEDIKVAYLFFVEYFKEEEAKKARRRCKKEEKSAENVTDCQPQTRLREDHKKPNLCDHVTCSGPLYPSARDLPLNDGVSSTAPTKHLRQQPSRPYH